MTSSSSTYFQRLTEKERNSKLEQAVRKGSGLTVWTKGSGAREPFSLLQYKSSEKRIFGASKTKTEFAGKKVLFTFALNGVDYFGSAACKSTPNGTYVFDLEDGFYKSERRENFRLLTFPHHKVFVHLKLEGEELQASNVLGIKSGLSETGLFQNFLSIIRSDEEVFREGYAPFRALDISVTGVAILVGELEEELFENGMETGPLLLEFNGSELEIPGGAVVYNVSMIAPSTDQKTRKVGIKFLNVDIETDQKLARLINGALRDFESEFEDFIK